MENGQDPNTNPDIDRFVDEMLSHAYELHGVLRKEGDKNDIKDRITCLKYLEEVIKTNLILKKASSHDADVAAAGSSVRKYATAFSKDATGGGAPRKRGRKPAAFIPTNLGGDDIEDDSDTAA